MIAALDTTVLLDLVAEFGPEQHAATHVVSAAIEGQFEALVAIQSIQEFTNVRLRRGISPADVMLQAEWVANTFRIVDHREEDLAGMLDILERGANIGAADALIFSSARRLGADWLVTRDQAFGKAFGKGWIDPMDPDSLLRLTGPQ